MKDHYNQAPCSNCPFRKDCLQGWLGEERMKEICEVDSFVCHKNHKRQCAGHIHVTSHRNVFNRIALLQTGKVIVIKNAKVLFKSIKGAIKHHTRNANNTKTER